MPTLVLSTFQAEALLRARQAGQAAAKISPDLGLTTVAVQLDPAGVIFPGGLRLRWADVEAIHENVNGCFLIEAEAGESVIRKIQVFSEVTNRLCSLMPTPSAPTLLIGGFPMHRIKDTDPCQDTLSKVRAIAPLTGQVLDTSTGLGYTAIEAARSADAVVTIELDPAVLEVGRLNPWSRGLFENPKIRQIVGDSAEVITTFERESFSRILHDPPTFSLAGELYSGAFYAELYRVLRRKGRLFHYIGDLESESGRRVAKGAIRRLEAAGFAHVARRGGAFGLVAYKD